MQITTGDRMMRDGEVLEIKDKHDTPAPIIISDTIPKFIQDQKGTWIKNPEWSDN